MSEKHEQRKLPRAAQQIRNNENHVTGLRTRKVPERSAQGSMSCRTGLVDVQQEAGRPLAVSLGSDIKPRSLCSLYSPFQNSVDLLDGKLAMPRKRRREAQRQQAIEVTPLQLEYPTLLCKIAPSTVFL